MFDELKAALARFEKEIESLFQHGNMQQAHGAMKEMAAATQAHIDAAPPSQPEGEPVVEVVPPAAPGASVGADLAAVTGAQNSTQSPAGA